MQLESLDWNGLDAVRQWLGKANADGVTSGLNRQNRHFCCLDDSLDRFGSISLDIFVG